MICHFASLRQMRLPLVLTVVAIPFCLIASRSASADPTPSANVLGLPITAPGGDPLSGDAQTCGDFTVLGSTQSGDTLFITLPGAQTLAAAITQTADALGKILDAKPDVTGAFADSQSQSKGGALFTGTIKGTNVRGWIFCSVAATGGGAAGSVVIAPATVTQADAKALFGFLPSQPKMQTYTFPDGSGSVDLPDGWTTQQQSLTFGVLIKGPAGQMVVMGNSILVNTPDCRMVRTNQQTYQLAMQMYRNQMNNYQQALLMHERFPNTMMPIQPTEPAAPDPDPNRQWPQLNFCRYCAGPDEVLKYWYPISQAKQQRTGGAYTSLDKIIEVVPSDPNPLIDNDQAGVAYLAVTDHIGDQTTSMRVLNRIETYPILDGKDAWMMVFNTMRAPDATFDRDLPLMNAIMSSFKMNMDVVNGEIAQSGAAVRKMGQDNEREMLKRAKAFDEQQAEQFDDFESRMAAQQKAVHDASSDEIEFASGLRDVYDTETGDMEKVDLLNVHGIVAGLNDATDDPNRFIEIPLRYER